MKHQWSPRSFADQARRLRRSDETINAALAAAKAVKDRDVDLPVVLTLSHLAYLAGINPGTARAYAARTWNIEPYRVFKLKKRPKPNSRAPSRGFREICVPEPDLMRLQRWIAQNILSRAVPHPCSFAFHRDRGVLKAAERHCGSRWLIKLDVRDFFQSITERQCYGVFRSLGYGALISFELSRICTRGPKLDRYKGAVPAGDRPYPQADESRLPQGAPTSPVLANMVVEALDTRLSALAASLGWTYTRYADDMAFSTPADASRGEAGKIIALAKAEVRRFGLELNGTKTVVAPPGARRIVLGLLVDGGAAATHTIVPQQLGDAPVRVDKNRHRSRTPPQREGLCLADRHAEAHRWSSCVRALRRAGLRRCMLLKIQQRLLATLISANSSERSGHTRKRAQRRRSRATGRHVGTSRQQGKGAHRSRVSRQSAPNAG